MRTRKVFMVFLALAVFCLTACATAQSPTTMTPKQQATIWMSVYNSTYDDTMNVMKSPTSTPAQKAIALQKKDILVKVWPLLKVYVSVVESGGTPSASDTAAIMDLINQLATLGTGGK